MYQNLYNQPNSLPADPVNITGQFLNLSLNNPPFVPNYTQCSPVVQQALPLIAASAALAIQTYARENVVRIFAFNFFSQNNYANEQFSELVAGAADYIELGLAKNSYANIEQAVQTAVPEVLELFCADNLRRYPELERYMDPNLVRAVRQALSTFDLVRNEISNYKRAVQSQQSNRYAPAPAYNAPPPYGAQHQGGRDWRTPAPASTYLQSSNSSGIFNRGGVSPYNNPQQAGKSMASRFNERVSDAAPSGTTQVLAQPFISRQEKPMQSNQTAVPPLSNEPALIPAVGSDIQWKATQLQPYPVAYNPTTHTLFYQIVEDGKTIPVLKEKQPNMMEYDKHVMSDTFGPLPHVFEPMMTTVHTAEVLERLEEGVKQINADRTEPKPEPKEGEEEFKPRVLVKKSVIAEPSLDTAWLLGAVSRLKDSVDGERPDVYRVYVKHMEPILGVNDESDVVKRLGRCTTYLELRNVLNDNVGTISQELWNFANDRATEMINRMIRRNLSIPALAIESFVNDIEDLLGVINDEHGEDIFVTVERHQASQIRSTFKTPNEDVASAITNELIYESDYKEGQAPKITYISSDLSFTYLNCLAHELNLALNKDVASAIIRSNTPVIHDLVESLFIETDEEGNFDRHFIRTNDNRILEATKGHIGSNFFLISLVK